MHNFFYLTNFDDPKRDRQVHTRRKNLDLRNYSSIKIMMHAVLPQKYVKNCGKDPAQNERESAFRQIV